MIRLLQHMTHCLVRLPRRMCLTRLAVASLVLLSLLAPTTSVAAEKIKQLIVFGDSLSDNGNFYRASIKLHNKFSEFPIIPIPSVISNGQRIPVYWNGRFSNGPVWNEVLANKLGLDENNTTTYRNYAFGGSWAESMIFPHNPFIPSLSKQVATYLATLPDGKIPPDTLFTVWSGANDYIHNRRDPNIATTLAVAAVDNNLVKLINAGGRYFIVPNLPDLGLTPEAQEKGENTEALLQRFSILHNQKLASMLKKLTEKYPPKQYPQLTLLPLDIFALFNDVQSNPNAYGIIYPLKPCYTGPLTLSPEEATLSPVTEAGNPNLSATDSDLPVLANFADLFLANQMAINLQSGAAIMCPQPNQHLFFEHLHPTEQIHQEIATQAETALEHAQLALPANN